MTEDLTLPKEFSLQELTLHELAKKCWGDFVLREIVNGERIFIPRETEKLIAHRETVINNLPHVLNSLPKTFSTDLPKQLRDKLVNAVICLQQGYSEALIWEEKCQAALPFTILNPLTTGLYSAKNFIDPAGHFDDLAWAKRFVADENQFVRCRFKLACFYCFEETIADLWHTMKTNGQLPYEGRLARIKSTLGDLVGLWAYQLENKIDELIQEDSNYADGFYACGLTEAIYRGHEYAARFFWARCSDTEKANFLREPDFDLLSDAAENNHTGLVNFIYSLLPLEQKNNLLSWTIQNNRGTAWIWSCLLHSPFYESVLKDILTFPFPVPSRIYECLLTLLTYKMKELQIPTYKTIFKALWNHLPKKQQKEVFEMDSYIIINLAKIKAMDLLKTIIQPLSHAEKERMLLRDWQSAGKSALDEFSKVGDYDALLHYLLFFFIDHNPITQKLNLRGDATDFLDRFIKGEFFIAWTKKQIPESEEKEVNKVIESLQGSLQVLHQLLEQVEHATPSFHDISSPKKTYPSLPLEGKSIHSKGSDIASQKLKLKRPAEDNDNDEINPKKQKMSSTHSPVLFIPVNPMAQVDPHSDGKTQQPKMGPL